MTGKEMKDRVYELARDGAGLIDPDYVDIIGATLELLRGKAVKLPGFLKGDKLERYLEKLTGGKSIGDLKMKTIITAVDLRSRKTIAYINAARGVRPVKNVVWKTDARLSAAMRASSAVPAFFEPVELDGMCLVDGGVTDVVPVDLLIAAGEPNVLGVDVSNNTPLSGEANIFDVCNHSLSILMNCLSEYRASGEKLMITPPIPDTAWILTFDQVIACMDAGYSETKKLMPVIKNVFKTNG
jgi:NTE family protein